MYNDKMIENINTKLENLSSYVKNQLSFNKMIETQIVQIAVSIIRGKSWANPRILRICSCSCRAIKEESWRWTINVEPLPKVNR